MPLTINLVDIPSEGQPVIGEISPTEMALPSDDGTILGPLKCVGQVLSSDDRMAHFEGKLTGRVARECVRCLSIFEEDIFLECNADFSQQTPTASLKDSSKNLKKTTRRSVEAIDETEDQDVDMYPITESQIDLLPALREDLILGTPPHPLCEVSCAGLCQACGVNLNGGVCACNSPVTASSSLDVELPLKVDKHRRNRSSKHVQIRAR